MTTSVIEHTTLIVPGLNSSGPLHWQTWLERQVPDAVRVIQPDWKTPNLAEWAGRVRREISRQQGQVLIAAHSFGVLAAVQAAEDHRHRIAGALLVAPADPEKFGVEDFLPFRPLGFPATLVASTNDPWISIENAARWAARWNAEFVNIGQAGHINAESGYGAWAGGLKLLERLARVSPAHNGHAILRGHRATRRTGFPDFGGKDGGPIADRYGTTPARIRETVRF